MKNQIVLNSDVFDITGRLKEIDPSYFVVYNFDSKKYEVHSSAQKGSTYSFTSPFSTLDARVLEYARKTSVRRREEIIKEIDLNNEKIEKERVKQTVECLKEVLE